MKSDITLEDYKINIASKQTEISSDNYKIEVSNNSIEIDGNVVNFGKQKFTMRGGRLILGDNQAQSNKHVMRVTSESGSSSIYSSSIRTPAVYTENIVTKELMIGLSPDDNPKPGGIKVINKQGKAVVTIDGEKEKINTNKIEAKEAKIEELVIGSSRLAFGPISTRYRNLLVDNATVSEYEQLGGIVERYPIIRGRGVASEAPGFYWEPVPGSINFINKRGDNAIVIDGAKEDIWLESIGSLKDKIKELDDVISKLKNAHPEIDF